LKIYSERAYRQQFRNNRWHGFVAKYKETDVWIGVDKKSFRSEMPEFIEQTISVLRDEIDFYLEKDPHYRLSLTPYPTLEFAPEILKKMSKVSFETSVGPMAAVAGAFAEYIAQKLKKQFKIDEIIVENGGDIYVDIQNDIEVSVFAGESPLSEKIGLKIDAKKSPLGICTSSGTVGHSLSFGKADAVMIICQDAILSDAYATVFANKIQTSEDINPVLKQIENEKNILAALLVKNDKMGIVGQFDLKLFA
jgi:ApbE superfamily uncharacterized protein (UPF0280 family)